MQISSQTFLVLGLSKSGFSACKYIISNGGKCYFYEEYSNKKIDDNVNYILSLGGIRLQKDNVYEYLDKIDVLVISPGVAISHEVAVSARKRGIRIIGEFELGLSSTNPTFVAITGTNGKTTTTYLIDSILEKSKKSYVVCGNIGEPICDKTLMLKNSEICLAEISSYQLETATKICPHIACVLNITPDHLKRHFTMENYVFLKKRIIQNQTSSEFAILNYDDEIVKGFAEDTNAKTIFVSTKGKVNGSYEEDGKLYYLGEYIIDRKDIPLECEYNTYNILYAIAVAKILGVENNIIVDALKNFKGVKHRNQLVAVKGGVYYVNDSKATNTASTISAIKGLKRPTILILGGSEKGEDYKELFENIKRSEVKGVIITGASRTNMLQSAVNCGYYDLTITRSFETAVKVAQRLAEEGDEVLLSPACASFDFFTSFEERGDLFIKMVESFS